MSERDAMICRSCGKEERASEGYPCEECGTFICQLCSLRGVTRCAACSGAPVPPTVPARPAPGDAPAGP